MMKHPILLFFLLSLAPSWLYAKTMVDNPFGPNVIIFDPTMKSVDINQKINQIYVQQKHNEFGEQRYAFLFAPGKYGSTDNVDVRVGYYTQVLGLGVRPEDVTIKGAVRTQDLTGTGALYLYWRAAENLTIQPTLGSIGDATIPKDQNVWAVSQGCQLRRINIISGSLRLYDRGRTNGGYLADSLVQNTIIQGAQPHSFMRNCKFGLWDGVVNPVVFVGDFGSVRLGTWPKPPYTIVDKTPLLREKPYLFFDKVSNQYNVNIRTRRRNVAGTDWQIAGTSIPITDFYIAKPGATAAQLNAALQSNKHLFFTPGIYHLEDSIKVTNSNTILFGIGFPTLVNDSNKPAIIISDTQGVHVAGLLFDAGAQNAATLLQVGESVNANTHLDPTYLYDVFCRIGGVSQYAGKAKSCVVVNSNDVVIDNTWLWRADHGSNYGWLKNTSDNGIVVNGKNVIIYNLQVDHHQKYQVAWNGDDGSVYQFASELPSDVPRQDVWMDGKIRGFAAFKIANNVIGHQLRGNLIIALFINDIWLDTAIATPANTIIQHTIGLLLGNPFSGVKHVINNTGCGLDQMNEECYIP